ncbi:TIGR04197 family type VII secretion effector [Alkalicoccobacillus murimartini]|uniref:Type VII secretion effector (TIGR04197 family) n=1 Tax=Alkalicoccobacillus murimartini TaxID=171685 RepID=A0ABT9YKB4_9BACI|nr:TIGR04197 family type VII secretion effector [Alkalicoccobacillus murimartini]MDQ0208298.1 type VII secretion effector (TIGR04197 family) [Alkalicoccobacillus murimartini]
MSDEIKLDPQLQKLNVSNIRTSSQNLEPTATVYNEGWTELDSITLVKQNLVDLQRVVRQYKSLVETNSTQIESLVEQFSQAEEQVAEGIKR